MTDDAVLYSYKEHGGVDSYPDLWDAQGLLRRSNRPGWPLVDPAFVTLFPGLPHEILHKT